MEPRLLDFEVNGESVVWDVGGFEGRWALAMKERGAAPVVYEPVPEYAAALLHHEGLTVRAYGLSDHPHTGEIVVAGDRSSEYTGNGMRVSVGFCDVAWALGDTVVDVLKLNVEGAEYPILERLLSTGKIVQIRSLLVQFHTFIPSFGERYLAIRRGLERTHTLKWRERFVWERWDLKGEGNETKAD